jgi:predicted ATP-grasp superfamily ATP-dependent carboligase
LVILGTSVTALAVARNAADLGMRPLVIDTANDIAASTRRAEVRLLANAEPDEVLEHLAQAAKGTHAWLIATSDAWLRFVSRYRQPLERQFDEILHPGNSSLAICLNKAEFARWCIAQSLPVPRSYDPARVLTDTTNLPFPLLLRPQQSSVASPTSIPKAVEARDPLELSRWLAVFAAASVTPLLNESLLGRRLTQYSVGAARRGDAMITFVAVKRRPLPEVCAVGSYVELAPNEAVEAIARRALQALDYHGIAEVEVLHDEESGQNYLIEINARPWVQYGLGVASGHDLLAFMLDPSGFDPRRAAKTGRRWMNLSADLYYSFSRSVGLVRDGRVPLGAYVSSVLRANTFAYLSWADPGPARRNLRQFLASLTEPRA